MHRLEFTPAAQRMVAKLGQRTPRRDFERVSSAIDGLAYEPRPRGVKKIKSGGDSYRMRIGNYRVVYRVYDGDSLVVVSYVGLRNEATYR